MRVETDDAHTVNGGEPAESRHIPVLDGLRAVSIVLVLMAHLLPLGPKAMKLNVTAGAMGMSLFFALSGFLIVKALRHSSVSAFLIRRLARVLPLAWLFILIVAILYPMSLEALAASVGLLLNYRPDLMLPVTEHLWSLGVEMHFYFGIALLMLFGRGALRSLWIACFLVTPWRILAGAEYSILTHLRVDEILIGACVATLSRRWLMNNAAQAWLLPAALVAWFSTSHPDAGWLLYLRPYATGVLLAGVLTLPDGFVRRALSAAIPRYIATVSYALYVIHPLFAHGWWNVGSVYDRYLVKRPLGLIATILLAHLSTFYWERFWTNAARRWLKRPNLSAPYRTGARETGASEPKVVERQSLP